MPTRQPVSKRRAEKCSRAAADVVDVYGVPVPRALHEAIETERGKLAKADSLLGCLAISLESEGDCAQGPYYPDIARMARELVRQSINGLDSLTLQDHVLRNKVREEFWLSVCA